MNKPLDVLCIGNAITDVLSFVEDDFLEEHTLSKGIMSWVDEDRSQFLYDALKKRYRNTFHQCAGGSAANSMAAFASLGGRGEFVGLIKDDALGKIFSDSMKNAGVIFDPIYRPQSSGSGICLSLVTPDAERTMQTFLGASIEFDDSYVTPEKISRARYSFIEGYLCEPACVSKAATKMAKISKEVGTQVILAASDAMCISRNPVYFDTLMPGSVDIFIANEDEIKSLTGQSDIKNAVEAARKVAPIIFITQGNQGSMILSGNQTITIKAAQVPKVIDTTGAGDAYAAGVLYGLSQDLTLQQTGQLATLIASEVITHLGARYEHPLKPLLSQLDKVMATTEK